MSDVQFDDFHGTRDGMNRAINDNALLRDIQRFEDVGTIYKTISVVALTAIGIGCFWFLCVAYRAGVLA